MPLICDAHVHIYSCFNLLSLLKLAKFNLAALSHTLPRSPGLPNNPTQHAICLTERHDCHYFERLSGGEFSRNLENSAITKHRDLDSISIKFHEPLLEDDEPLIIVAGRQIVTKERVELLSLCSRKQIPDGLPVEEALEQISHLGAVPVINWAPGKWRFNRGKIVSELISKFTPQQIAIGDTTLRPRELPEPALMKHARNSGFTVIAGSDPLPFSGEQGRIGTYGMYSTEELTSDCPAESLKRLLLSPKTPWQAIGKRNSLFQLGIRLQRHRTEGKRHSEKN